MPTTTTVSSNYAGKEAGAIIGASFKEADTLAKGLITPMENVNYKLSLRRIRLTNGIQAYSCGHTPAGAIILNEREIAPVKLKNDFDVCKEDFRSTWSSELLGASASNPNMAADIQAAILAEVLGEQSEWTDSKIWTGDNTANSNEWDGYITLFTADASVIKLNNTGTGITSANVLAEMAKVRSAIPVSLRRKDLVFAVSPDIADAYAQALIEQKITNGLGGGLQTNEGADLVYGRYGIYIVNGLPDNTMVVYERKNLVFATGLLGDHNSVAIVDEDEIGLLTGKVRGKMVFNGGVNYYNSEDIVYYLATAGV